jgi:hypothetical protein
VEDSGDWNVFNDGAVIFGGKKRSLSNPISQTIISNKPSYPLIPYIRISVKPSYQGLGIIHPKPWFVNRVRNLFWMKIAKYSGIFEIIS